MKHFFTQKFFFYYYILFNIFLNFKGIYSNTSFLISQIILLFDFYLLACKCKEKKRFPGGHSTMFAAIFDLKYDTWGEILVEMNWDASVVTFKGNSFQFCDKNLWLRPPVCTPLGGGWIVRQNQFCSQSGGGAACMKTQNSLWIIYLFIFYCSCSRFREWTPDLSAGS